LAGGARLWLVGWLGLLAAVDGLGLWPVPVGGLPRLLLAGARCWGWRAGVWEKQRQAIHPRLTSSRADAARLLLSGPHNTDLSRPHAQKIHHRPAHSTQSTAVLPARSNNCRRPSIEGPSPCIGSVPAARVCPPRKESHSSRSRSIHHLAAAASSLRCLFFFFPRRLLPLRCTLGFSLFTLPPSISPCASLQATHGARKHRGRHPSRRPPGRLAISPDPRWPSQVFPPLRSPTLTFTFTFTHPHLPSPTCTHTSTVSSSSSTKHEQQQQQPSPPGHCGSTLPCCHPPRCLGVSLVPPLRTSLSLRSLSHLLTSSRAHPLHPLTSSHCGLHCRIASSAAGCCRRGTEEP